MAKFIFIIVAWILLSSDVAADDCKDDPDICAKWTSRCSEDSLIGDAAREFCLKTCNMCPVQDEYDQTNYDAKSEGSKRFLCPVCQWAMTKLKSLTHGSVTKGGVQEALNVLCNFAPFGVGYVCQILVSRFAGPIIKKLVDGIPFNMVCSSIGLCDSAVKNVIGNPLIEATGGKCAFCHLYMAKSASLLCNDKSQICDKVHSSLQEDCSAFEDAHRGKVTALLNEDVEPSLVCARIGFCKRSDAKSQDNNADLSHLSSRFLCPVCQWAMTKLKSLIPGTMTAGAVQMALDELCNFAPFGFGGICQTLVKKFDGPIVMKLGDGIPFNEVCGSIGLCDSAVKNFIGNPSIEDSGEKCTFCHLYMDMATRESARLFCNVKNQNFGVELDQNICNKVDSSLQEDCSAFEDAHRGKVKALLNEDVDPSLVCARIGFCKRSVNRINPASDVQRKTGKSEL